MYKQHAVTMALDLIIIKRTWAMFLIVNDLPGQIKNYHTQSFQVTLWQNFFFI